MVGQTGKSFTTAQPGWRALFYEPESHTFFELELAGWLLAHDNNEGYDYVAPQVWSDLSLEDPLEIGNFCAILSPAQGTPSIESEEGIRLVQDRVNVV